MTSFDVIIPNIHFKFVWFILKMSVYITSQKLKALFLILFKSFLQLYILLFSNLSYCAFYQLFLLFIFWRIKFPFCFNYLEKKIVYNPQLNLLILRILPIFQNIQVDWTNEIMQLEMTYRVPFWKPLISIHPSLSALIYFQILFNIL